MKKFIVASVVMLFGIVFLTPHAQTAERASIGLHGGYSMGGDVETSNFAYGGQFEIGPHEFFSIETSLSRGSEEFSVINSVKASVDVTSIGLSLIGRTELVEKTRGYILGGINYNFFTNEDIDIPSPYDRYIAADVNIDNSLGFHVGAGLGIELLPAWELFTEYRHTFMTSTDTTYSAYGYELSQSESFDFGLFKVGMNFFF